MGRSMYVRAGGTVQCYQSDHMFSYVESLSSATIGLHYVAGVFCGLMLASCWGLFVMFLHRYATGLVTKLLPPPGSITL